MNVGDLVELRYGYIQPGQRRKALVIKDTSNTYTIQVMWTDNSLCENVNKKSLRVISESR